uniref:C-type lectin domain-containing protein n=1 Tax=Hippocampus comes TaxID=109280 RepID=A0A3Q2Z3W6_HIPCM
QNKTSPPPPTPSTKPNPKKKKKTPKAALYVLVVVASFTRRLCVACVNRLVRETAAVQDRQELLSDKLEEQLATLYANFCGTPEERGHPIRCCKEGWVKNASHCYWLSERIRSWEGARKHCVAKNSLLSVNDHLSNFMWVDGSPLSTPVFWRPREPNNMAQRYVDNIASSLPVSSPHVCTCRLVFL